MMKKYKCEKCGKELFLSERIYGNLCWDCYLKQQREITMSRVKEEKKGGEGIMGRLGGKFKLGQLLMSRGVNDRVAESEEFAVFVWQSLKRHARGDWGDLPEEDKKENEFSLHRYLRLMSAYKNGDTKIWIITEADRSATTILFPEEY